LVKALASRVSVPPPKLTVKSLANSASIVRESEVPVSAKVTVVIPAVEAKAPRFPASPVVVPAVRTSTEVTLVKSARTIVSS
jgi:uncharacterized secreted protein with C-terminal beta-propeller domain